MSEVYPVTVFVSNGDSTEQPATKARIVILKEGTESIEYYVEEKNSPLRQVRIQKKSDGFGISIKGGKEHSRPIIISKCDSRHKDIKLGDRLISCNDKSLLNSFHKDVVEAIRNSGEMVKFEVQGENWEKTEMPIEIPEIYKQICNSRLWMTRLSRASKYGENSIEIASACLKTRFIIKAESEPIADMFVRSFQKAKASANSANFPVFNELLKKNAAFEHTEERMKDLTTPDCHIHNLDWFYCEKEKKHYLMALTNHELRLYYSMPTEWTEWNQPIKTISLLATRAVIYHGNLLLRTGTRKEVEILELRCSNATCWIEDIHRVTKECVKQVNEAQVEVIHENETAYLGIHWSDGLRLYKLPNRKVVWNKSIQLLSLIDDDNQANLTLEFKDNTKFTFVLGDGLRPFIFLMLNFVETQCAMLTNNNNKKPS